MYLFQTLTTCQHINTRHFLSKCIEPLCISDCITLRSVLLKLDSFYVFRNHIETCKNWINAYRVGSTKYTRYFNNNLKYVNITLLLQNCKHVKMNNDV